MSVYYKNDFFSTSSNQKISLLMITPAVRVLGPSPGGVGGEASMSACPNNNDFLVFKC